ncbi:MAG TPA: RAD52 family DNA repair protein [Candidatus Paceibacterota bacterium]|nr:RAD52 family DNA repair protein [Candidatus Paceibacterota bacterium]
MFTDAQKAALSAKLDGAHVKQRKQAGRQLSYIEGWWAIAEANRIFGYDAWDRETVELRLLSERATKIGANKDRDGHAVAYMARVRVRVIVGERAIIREGCGYGSGIDVDLGSAHESAIKEAETDAMKRGLMTFGNPFGLALYDKDQENVEHNGNGHKPAEDSPDVARAKEMAHKIKAGIDKATSASDAALGLKVAGTGKDREDVAEIRKHLGDGWANRLHELAAFKIAELTKPKDKAA